MSIDFNTGGESHGKGIVGILNGIPAGLSVSKESIDRDLLRRQGGYGRGGRMEIESDKVEMISGIYHGKTIGTPISFQVRNNDWANWKKALPPFSSPEEKREVVIPRPGHADLAGVLKYGFRDCRKVLERASARETAARVVAGNICKQLLGKFDIGIFSRVVRIGPVKDESERPDFDRWEDCVEGSPLRVCDKDVEKTMAEEIDKARERGDSLGGIFEVIAVRVPPGLGCYSSSLLRLDARLAQGFMSIPGIKSVEIGEGKSVCSRPGSEVHDEIYHDEDRGFFRTTNRAGGLEGGVTNGQSVIVKAGMKPIPTLAKPLRTVNIVSGEKTEAAKERSDVCAVPAASIVGEAQIALQLADGFLDKFAGDDMESVEHAYGKYGARINNWFGTDG